MQTEMVDALQFDLICSTQSPYNNVRNRMDMKRIHRSIILPCETKTLTEADFPLHGAQV